MAEHHVRGEVADVGQRARQGSSARVLARGKALRVLIVEDSEDDLSLVLRALIQGGYAPTWERVQSAEAMNVALEKSDWELILSDYCMPGFSGPEALELARRRRPETPFVIVSGTVGEELAVAAVRAGARDYVLKDALIRLVPTVERELEEAAQRRQRRVVEERLALSERMLLQSQKMEAIGRLAAGVAHDFNNMLAVIAGYSGLLLADCAEGNPDREKLDEIHRAAMRSGELTRQLLAFSRQLVLSPRVLDLNHTVTSVERMLRRVIGEDITLVTALAPDLGRIKVDPGQIEQVILNLVVNARDAMPGGGTLTLETANVDLDAAYAAEHPDVTPGPHVMLAITDDGAGMTPEIQLRVFEPFFTTKEVGRGTGLGLSTVFGIVRQSGGTIWLYSEAGKGTTFKIYLPRTDETVSGPSSIPKSNDLRGNERVLLVEDEATVRRAVAAVLRRYGYEVVEADGPQRALEICQDDTRFDLLITDVVMPGMSGRDLAERISTLKPDLRILYTSGYTDNTVFRQGGIPTGVHFLQKPFMPEALARKIREALKRR